MKIIFRSVLFVSLMTMGLVSCSDDDSDDVQTTTVQASELPADVTAIAIGSPAHTILVEALTKANLVGALQEDGPFTVFAPTNDAFVALLATNDDWNSLDDIPADVLEAVLLDHVVAGSVTSSTLAGPYTTLGGKTLTVEDLTAAGFTDGAIDLQAQNGYVHSINGVLLLGSQEEAAEEEAVALPADVTAIAIGSPAHTILVEALTKANLVGALQEDGPFTVFAPTNDAFVALLATNDDWNSLNDIPTETLKAVLLDHVVAGSVTSSTLAGPYTTLGGKTLTVEDLTDAGFTDGAIDLQAQNGYVHSINGVLLLAD